MLSVEFGELHPFGVLGVQHGDTLCAAKRVGHGTIIPRQSSRWVDNTRKPNPMEGHAPFEEAAQRRAPNVGPST
jgi:hypothetical protein